MRNFREVLTTEAQIKGFVNLPRTDFHDYIFSTAYDALTYRNGIRILVVNSPKARAIYDEIFYKLGFRDLSGNKYIIGNSVILFSPILDMPRGTFYRYIIEDDLNV